MLGPVVELELVNPLDKVPDGVEFSIRHFLTVPHSPEAHEALDNPEDEHQIVKLTKVEGRLEVQVIDSIHSVTSEYFTTRKLAGRPQRDPGISRDPGIDLESRSRDFGKSNPGIFRDLSYQTKQ